MIQSEYARFLGTLAGGTVSDDVRRIANLVFENLDELIPLTTAHGQRIKKIVGLSQSNWDAISPNIQLGTKPAPAASQTSSQLKQLTVGPFRGFAKQEVFDLSSEIVLIYGPNGTGKSSFCEALEYGLLGNVAEADSKRFKDQRQYLKNAHSDAFEAPEIVGVGDVRVVPDEAAYRFCFVEKNRIDNFSRIAAQAPAKQMELISTLFGLDSFNDFVRNFTPSIDNKYIDLEGAKTNLLAEKYKALAGYQEQISSSEEDLKRIESEELTLAKGYREGISFKQMIEELNGSEEHPGVIKKLEDELQRPVPVKSNLSSGSLQSLRQSITTATVDLASKQSELEKASQDISFKQLYEAVLNVQLASADRCPACKTLLGQTTVNPFENAHKELETLKHLTELQNSVQTLEYNLNQTLLSLSQVVSKCCEFFPASILHDYQLAFGSHPSVIWWNSFHQVLQDGYSPWQHLEVQVKQLEESDKATELINQERANKQTQLASLRNIASQTISLGARRDAISKAVTHAMGVVASFNVENAQLIADVEKEKGVVARNIAIATAYEHFVSLLNDYKNALPSQLVADMGEMVVALYNAFNRNDYIKDQLSAARLPLAQNERLEISFINAPEVFFDALHVLSEGHIRCLGLAILIAKNLKENCPILIFDDPVNAIDEDHRESIRRTLFEDDHFEGRQIILTCHGEEFFKDIQNILSASEASQSKTFTFLPRLGEQHIRVDYNCKPRNYVVSAKKHLDNGEIRDALGKSRQALESLTKEKLWRYVNRYGDGNLSLKFRSPKAPIELRNLTEQLKSKIGKADFSDPNKDAVLNPIASLLGINGNSREWRYLNKGTHEEADRAEFDRSTVQEIINYLDQLDIAFFSSCQG